MIVLLDTSTPTCLLSVVIDDDRFDYEWFAERNLAKGLHGFVHAKLQEHSLTWQDISGIGVFKGPGSYTGLRIGLTVMNTLADGLGVPIVGANGEDWRDDALKSLVGGENHQVVLPEYGGQASITQPRK